MRILTAIQPADQRRIHAAQTGANQPVAGQEQRRRDLRPSACRDGGSDRCGPKQEHGASVKAVSQPAADQIGHPGTERESGTGESQQPRLRLLFGQSARHRKHHHEAGEVGEDADQVQQWFETRMQQSQSVFRQSGMATRPPTGERSLCRESVES